MRIFGKIFDCIINFLAKFIICTIIAWIYFKIRIIYFGDETDGLEYLASAIMGVISATIFIVSDFILFRKTTNNFLKPILIEGIHILLFDGILSITPNLGKLYVLGIFITTPILPIFLSTSWKNILHHLKTH